MKKLNLSTARFTVYYALYSALIAAIAYFIPLIFPNVQLLTGKFWVIYFFFAGITYIAYLGADFGLKRNPETGIMAIMGAIAVKMFFSMAFVLIYSLNSKEKGMVFVLNFFSLYLLFSFFEIYALLRNLRHQNK